MLVDPAHAHDVGPVTDAEDLPAAPPALDDGGDAQAELDLGNLGHPMATLDEPALGGGVVADGIGVGEGGVEHLQVQRGLVVGGGMQHPRRRGRLHAHDRRVVEVRVEGDHLGVARRARRRRGRA